MLLHHVLVGEPDIGVEGEDEEDANKEFVHKEIFI